MAFSRCVLATVVSLLASSGFSPALSQNQNPPPEKSADAFFAGVVEELTADRVSVSRVAQGKTEKRDFRVTSDTKMEGRLRVRVRVTVRYTSSDDGDTATLIIIRPATKAKK